MAKKFPVSATLVGLLVDRAEKRIQPSGLFTKEFATSLKKGVVRVLSSHGTVHSVGLVGLLKKKTRAILATYAKAEEVGSIDFKRLTDLVGESYAKVLGAYTVRGTKLNKRNKKPTPKSPMVTPPILLQMKFQELVSRVSRFDRPPEFQQALDTQVFVD